MIAARPFVTAAAFLFLAIGVCALAFAAHVVIDARRYQAQARAQFVAETAAPPALAPRMLREGDPLGEIHSARIGLRAVIAEGDSPAVLLRAVGHVADTAAPGESGNVVLAAHRDTFFRPLRNVRVGDVITVTTRGSPVHYEVEWTAVVSPDELRVLEPTEGRAVTLITCHPFTFAGAAPDRFIVRARAMADPERGGARR